MQDDDKLMHGWNVMVLCGILFQELVHTDRYIWQLASYKLVPRFCV